MCRDFPVGVFWLNFYKFWKSFIYVALIKHLCFLKSWDAYTNDENSYAFESSAVDPANRTPAPPLRTTSAVSSSNASGIGHIYDGTDVGHSCPFSKPLPPTPSSEKRERRAKKGKQPPSGSLAPPPPLPNISFPMKVHHEVHVTIDPMSGEFTVCFYEIIGLFICSYLYFFNCLNGVYFIFLLTFVI